ncbi:MAG: class II aldolase/adducin family protein, partial [Pseudomonadota bacterium]|nr:class II aldolase/adducin family protein [Pseudomonadota bacterium]
IPHEMAVHTQKQVGSNLSGWFSGQPLFDVILSEQPDLLD